MQPILALWATPRSTSTAFEWMMRQRGDFVCHHEPFNELYYYGEDRRSAREGAVAAKPGLNYANVWTGLLGQAEANRIFLKDFAYSVMHMVDDAFLSKFTHSFLIRDPKKVLPALHHHWPNFTVEEAGFSTLRVLFERVAERDGKAPPVMTSEDLLTAPEATVAAYCAAVDIPFIAQALSWSPGERKEVSWYGEGRGPWHDNLRQSRGIEPQNSTYPPIESVPELMRKYEACLPDYQALLRHKLPISEPSERARTPA